MSAPPTPVPYKPTSVFGENTLPAGTARLEGRLRYRILDPASEVILEPGHPGRRGPRPRR
jgi:hypothetical protein